MTIAQFLEWCEYLALIDGVTTDSAPEPKSRRMPSEQIQAVLLSRLGPLIKRG